MFKKIILMVLILSFKLNAMPNVCTAIGSSQFNSCFDLSMSPTTCGWPPRPCVRISYYLPSYFVEVVSNPGETFFKELPFASMQLSALTDRIPFGAQEDNGSYSFHSHTLAAPFVSIPANILPCGGSPVETMCLGAMSEHLGRKWKTGEADSLQPLHLAFSAAPKACLITGAVQSAVGGSVPSPYPNMRGGCSFDRSWLDIYPPSAELACNGWGVFYPRYGTVTNSDQTTAATMIAARMKSLSSQVFSAMPSGGQEKYQMLVPQATSCFRQGQNVGLLRLKGINEYGRIAAPNSNNYLFSMWRKVSCTKEIAYMATTPLIVAATQAACKAFK